MARTNKVGIDYFSFDVDFFNDDKIQLIEAEFGISGSIIAIKLLCKIYKEGYYYNWGEDQLLLFTKNAGPEFTTKKVQDIVNGLIKRSFFDADCYDKYKILTSPGIQRRYLDATTRYLDVKLIDEYLLIDRPDRNNVTIIPLNVYINPINSDINPQRKGKEIEKKSKGENDARNTDENSKSDYQKFNEWIKENAPYCSNPKNIEHQITEAEFHKMKEKYNWKQISSIILKIENRSDLRKRYKNLYTTANSWLKNED